MSKEFKFDKMRQVTFLDDNDRETGVLILSANDSEDKIKESVRGILEDTKDAKVQPSYFKINEIYTIQREGE